MGPKISSYAPDDNNEESSEESSGESEKPQIQDINTAYISIATDFCMCMWFCCVGL